MSNVTVTATERSNQYILTEYKDHIGANGRLIAIGFFAIFGIGILYIFLYPSSFDPRYFTSLNPQEVAGNIAVYGSIFLVNLILFDAILVTAVFELLAAYFRLPEVFVDIFGWIQVLSALVLIIILIALAFPLSRFIVAPLVITFLRTPIGANLFSFISYLLIFLLAYISVSVVLCRYTRIREFIFDKGADQLTLRCQTGLPIFVTPRKDPHSDNIHFVPLWHFQPDLYEFPLSSIRSVHRYDKTPTLGLDVAGHLLYLPTVQCKNQRESEQIFATLTNVLRLEQGEDIPARTAKEKVQLREDVLRGIRTKVLPTEGEEAPFALLVASALTMMRRNQQRLSRQSDNPNVHLQLGIALLRSGERAAALNHIQEALRLYRLRFQRFQAVTVKQYLRKARWARHS